MWTASCPVVTEAVSFGAKQLNHEADYSHTSTAKAQNAGNYSFHSRLCLIKHSHNSTFAFILQTSYCKNYADLCEINDNCMYQDRSDF